jgi:hypothetical protein
MKRVDGIPTYHKDFLMRYIPSFEAICCCSSLDKQHCLLRHGVTRNREEGEALGEQDGVGDRSEDDDHIEDDG